MKIDIKEYFEGFINKHLTKENAYNVYIALGNLDINEFYLFKNCLKLLYITREEFFSKFAHVAEVYNGNMADGDIGYTQVAITDKFGKIEFEPHDNPECVSIKNMKVDNANMEFIKFHQELFYSAIRESIENCNENDFED